MQQTTLLYVDAGLDTRPLIHFDWVDRFIFVDPQIVDEDFQLKAKEVMRLAGFRPQAEKTGSYRSAHSEILYYPSMNDMSESEKITHCILKRDHEIPHDSHETEWIVYERIWDTAPIPRPSNFIVMRTMDDPTQDRPFPELSDTYSTAHSSTYVSYKCKSVEDFLLLQ